MESNSLIQAAEVQRRQWRRHRERQGAGHRQVRRYRVAEPLSARRARPPENFHLRREGGIAVVSHPKDNRAVMNFRSLRLSGIDLSAELLFGPRER